MNRILRLTRQAGVGIVTAIFLLVVLAGLGVAMVGIFTHQQASANLDLMGAQAYQAARAGLEWGLFRARSGTCTASETLPMPAGTSLSAFTVYVSCRVSSAGMERLVRYVIVADACNMPSTVAAPPPTSCPTVNKAESVRRTLEAER